ncbi:MAG: Tol-like receptor protein with LRR [Bacteroidetes bacterium]|nr:MAG: Tol-like receptor protein with LRR [Bacteroidota bacterium]
MDNEPLIRNEAKEFTEHYINRSNRRNAIDDFHIIKDRLRDFYTSESKAIFLDEIELNLRENLQVHRNKSHGGEQSPTCIFEINAEKILFYINQELETLPTVARQKFHPKNNKPRIKVFISYSHFDKEFLTDIQRHFKPFLKDIDYWDDTMIFPGQKWKEEIKKAIDETKIAILLVSTDFLGSDFIATNELPPLLTAAEEEGAVILTLILKPCLFESFGALNKFQAMNSPDKPVSKMDMNEKEELLVNLIRQTKRILGK